MRRCEDCVALHPLEGAAYRIKVAGRASGEWLSRACDMTLWAEGADGLVLCGPVPDQSALLGVLRRLRDLDLELVSVRSVPCMGHLENRSDRS